MNKMREKMEKMEISEAEARKHLEEEKQKSRSAVFTCQTKIARENVNSQINNSSKAPLFSKKYSLPSACVVRREVIFSQVCLFWEGRVILPLVLQGVCPGVEGLILSLVMPTGKPTPG